MLRECRRVLSPGGCLAGYVIHTPSDLDPRETARAAELGPSNVTATGSYAALLTQAGFSVEVSDDVTATFTDTAAALCQAREDLAESLRPEEGEEFYEEELRKLRAVLEGLAEGLLRRSFMVAVK